MEAKNRLTDLNVEEISFVDEGDNPEAHIIFSKAKNRTGANKGSDNTDDSLNKQDGGKTMTVEEMQAELDKANATIENLKGQIAEMQKGEYNEEDMMKSLPEDVRKKLESDMEEIAKAKEDLAKARDEQLEKEFIVKAKDANLTEGMGKVIKSLHSKDETLAKTVFDEMARLQKALDESELLKEKGHGGDGAEKTAHETLTEMAKEVQKTEKTMSFEKAYAFVKKNNPELSKKASRGE